MSPRIRPSGAPAPIKSLLIVLFLASVVAIGLALSTHKTNAANTWHVSVGNPGACTVADRNCATIKAAVIASSSGDTINVDAGTYNEHQIAIDHSLTINGATGGTIVDAQQLGRGFEIFPSILVNISGLTIKNGVTSTGLTAGGGIYNVGNLTLTNCTISNNTTINGANFNPSTSPETAKGDPKVTASGGGPGGNGAGIANIGTLTVNSSTISFNQTGSGGLGNGFGPGGKGGQGGGIWNGGQATIINSTIANNQTGMGGSSLGSLAAPEVTGKDSGGANGPGFSGGNGGEGAGISNGGVLTVRNSTVAFNQTGAGGVGGGLPASGLTLTGGINTPAPGTGFGGDGGGVYTGETSAGFTASSNIIANNSVGDGGLGPDVFSDVPVADQGFNLIGKTDGSSGFTQATTQKGTIASPLDPKFDAAGLANNGGPTKTIKLQSTSPAVDKGKKDASLTNDQRGPGFPRISDFPAITNAADGCDVGSFELPAPPNPCATDTTPPNIVCPASITRNATPGQLGANINPGSPTASDNCSLRSVTGVRSDGKALNALYPVGTTFITWTARDASNNAASCIQTIIVMQPGADIRKVTP